MKKHTCLLEYFAMYHISLLGMNNSTLQQLFYPELVPISHAHYREPDSLDNMVMSRYLQHFLLCFIPGGFILNTKRASCAFSLLLSDSIANEQSSRYNQPGSTTQGQREERKVCELFKGSRVKHLFMFCVLFLMVSVFATCIPFSHSLPEFSSPRMLHILTQSHMAILLITVFFISTHCSYYDTITYGRDSLPGQPRVQYEYTLRNRSLLGQIPIGFSAPFTLVV